jgi:phosphoribosylformylglycinamidine cyclo-ligase
VDGSRVEPGDLVLGLASSGVHSNGFSLVRKALFERKGYTVDSRLADLDKPLGLELLTPTRIYVRPILDLLRNIRIKAMAHITGGGFSGNIPRVLPENCRVTVYRKSWQVPPIFRILQREAGLDDRNMFDTFNMGIGFVVILSPEFCETVVDWLVARGIPSWIIGEVEPRGDREAVGIE